MKAIYILVWFAATMGPLVAVAIYSTN